MMTVINGPQSMLFHPRQDLSELTFLGEEVSHPRVPIRELIGLPVPLGHLLEGLFLDDP